MRVIATVILAIGAILSLLKNIGVYEGDAPIVISTAVDWCAIAFIIWLIWWL